MTETPSHRAGSFNLRDLLLYLIPGGVVLLAILVAAGDFPYRLNLYPGFAASLLGILIAYFLGHAIYPINYRLWKWILPSQECRKETNSESSEEPRRECSEECEYFSRAYSRVADKHWDYHISEVSRFRSLARFASAMIVPSVLLLLAAGIRLMTDFKAIPLPIRIPLGLAVAACSYPCAKGFAGRYRRYQLRFMNLVWRCEDCEPPWQGQSAATASSKSGTQTIRATAEESG